VTAIAIVPVRVDSQRLPRKALLRETGRPLFLHTWEAARRASCFADVLIATDSDEVEAEARKAGASVARTSPSCRTGSERCAEAARPLAQRIVVDIQGDWPEVLATDLERLVEALEVGPAPTATLARPLLEPAKINDPNVVKVVAGRSGQALYFSRSPIPYRKRPDVGSPTLRHIGVYGFTRETLLEVPDLPSSGLDEIEGLEQLRFLENGIAMRVVVAEGDPWGIETRADYDAFLVREAQRRIKGGRT
jgi:3-deoxy-manno-octulosonate cytidylyltransferase (CMP-KDO synthetase)